jgi:glycerol-3-phosphate acyltransferase PlsY
LFEFRAMRCTLSQRHLCEINYTKTTMLSIITIILVSYLIGSIPTSLIVSKFFRGIDIRQYGSGNAGGTNSFRVMGWRFGLFVTLFDMLKGIAAVVWIVSFFEYNQLDALPTINRVALRLIAGTMAIVGHIYTVFADFKGGKGVSTAVGMMIGLSPLTIAICALVFFVTMYLSRYVSLSSIIGAICIPLVIAIRKYVFHVDSLDYHLLIFGVIVAAIIIYAHRSNIERLRLGTESRVTFLDRKKK